MFRWLRSPFKREPEQSLFLRRIPPGSGWKHWYYEAPPQDAALVELWRDTWDAPIERRLAGIDPHMNVWGLYWRWPEAKVIE